MCGQLPFFNLFLINYCSMCFVHNSALPSYGLQKNADMLIFFFTIQQRSDVTARFLHHEMNENEFDISIKLYKKRE